MPRVCTICAHPKLRDIDRGLARGEPNRAIAQRFLVSPDALRRHAKSHLPVTVAKSEQAKQSQEADTLVDELRSYLGRVQKLYDACDAWLTDPDDPDKYTLAPRADDVDIVYLELDEDGGLTRRKAKLSTLLAQVEDIENVSRVVLTETKHTDPRELILKTHHRLEGHLTLMAKLLGEIQTVPDVNVNVLVDNPEWIRVQTAILSSLASHPEARESVKQALLEVDRNADR